MQSLTEVYDQIASKDADLEKQAAELLKLAEEEDAAGRIMARGFADELAKLAGPYDGGAGAFDTGPKGGSFGGGSAPSVKSGPYQTGGGKTGSGFDPMSKGRGGAGAGAASAAGGSAAKPVGAPPMGRQGSMRPATAGGIKPPSVAQASPKPPKM
jgi:hypothetical protein